MPTLKENDYVFFLGDGLNDFNNVFAEIPDKFYFVSGNCDFDRSIKECIVEVEGKKIFLTHGDTYGVKTSLDRIYYRAKELGVDIVFYGHTHFAKIEEIDGIQFINPGSFSKYAFPSSYCYTVITKEKIISKIVEISG